MATITGLTAARMLEIEAESIVDGDVVGNNLILTKHDGTTIDAGSVRGPQGSPGPSSNYIPLLGSVPILEAGQQNQVRSGRQLSVADFTTLLGLNQPIGLFNLSDLSNLGSGLNLSNKGSVPFGPGINGLAATAAVFAGSTGQALYIPDVGASDPFRIKSGSFGCWFKTAKRDVQQMIFAKDSSIGTNRGWYMWITTNVVQVNIPNDAGTGASVVAGFTDVTDDRWHFAVCTYDGTVIRLYVDGILENSVNMLSSMFGSTAPLNIGSRSADASTSGNNPFFGSVDEAFVISEVLSEDQIRLLACAKVAHGLASAPKRISLSVRRRKRGALLAVSDFPATPVRLYNLDGLTAAASHDDLGSNNQDLALGAGIDHLDVPGPDGARGGCQYFDATGYLAATDTGLPSGLSARSFGIWFKTTSSGGTLITWGTTVASNDVRIDMNSNNIRSLSAGAVITGPPASDGQWHFACVVEDNAAADGAKRKLYFDGRLVGIDSTMNSISSGGAGKFRLGADVAAGQVFAGHLARAFVYAGVLTAEQVRTLFHKGSLSLPASPRNSGDNVEAIDASNVYMTFGNIEPQNLVDLEVAA